MNSIVGNSLLYIIIFKCEYYDKLIYNNTVTKLLNIKRLNMKISKKKLN